jgi:hypothetical protein
MAIKTLFGARVPLPLTTIKQDMESTKPDTVIEVYDTPSRPTVLIGGLILAATPQGQCYWRGFVRRKFLGCEYPFENHKLYPYNAAMTTITPYTETIGGIPFFTWTHENDDPNQYACHSKVQEELVYFWRIITRYCSIHQDWNVSKNIPMNVKQPYYYQLEENASDRLDKETFIVNASDDEQNKPFTEARAIDMINNVYTCRAQQEFV